MQKCQTKIILHKYLISYIVKWVLKVKTGGKIVTLTHNITNYKETAQCGVTEMGLVLPSLRCEQRLNHKLAVGFDISCLKPQFSHLKMG